MKDKNDLELKNMAQQSFKVGSNFVKFLKKLDKWNNGINMNINESGISFLGIDDSRISLTSIKFDRDFFVDYNIKEELDLYIEFDEFKKIKRNNQDDTFFFEFNGQKLKITKNGKETFDLQFEIKRDLNIKQEYLEELTYDSQVDHIDLKYFKDMLKVFADRFSVISLDVKMNKISMSDYKDQLIFNFPEDYDLDIKSESKMGFYVPMLHDYLNSFCQIIKNDKIVMEVEDNKPLKLSYDAFGIKFYFFLAPRIEEEDDDDYGDDY